MICLIEPYLRKIQRLLQKPKLKHACALFIIIVIINVSGMFIHLFEKSYDKYFTYPYEGDILSLIEDLKHNRQPEHPPINQYNYTYIHEISKHCVDEDYHTIRIIFLIKSAVENFDRRKVIRKTWGYKKRFFDVPTRTVFLLGKQNDLQDKINEEAKTFKDIIQADFIDSYYNNTIKTMMGFKWAANHCRNSKFFMFVDDDMYVSVKNVLRFIRNPTSYPDYLKEPSRFGTRRKRQLPKMPKFIDSEKMPNNLNEVEKSSLNQTKMNIGRRIHQIDFDLPDDVRLFTGYVFISTPHRHKTSKWYVSLDEYPYDYWPPYVTAGAYIVSREAMIDMYYTSFYTKHFRFDDIFLGLVAKKADIEPFHCNEFHFYPKEYTKYNYKYVITSHGYGNSRELLEVWNEQKSMGNA